MRVVARNVRVDGGELDIIGLHGGKRVAFEVRSVTGDGDPAEAFDNAKARQVTRLAAIARCVRVDMVAVGFRADRVDLHWVRGVG